MSELYAVKFGEDWHIAKITKASAYSQLAAALNMPPDAEVWSEHRTTAYLGRIGEEDRSIELD